MLEDFNTTEMTDFTRGRQALRNSNSFWQTTKHSSPLPPVFWHLSLLHENKPPLALLCSWMGQSSGGLCANTLVAAPTAESPAQISLVCFRRQLYDSPNPNDKHKIFPSPWWFLMMALEVIL